ETALRAPGPGAFLRRVRIRRPIGGRRRGPGYAPFPRRDAARHGACPGARRAGKGRLRSRPRAGRRHGGGNGPGIQGHRALHARRRVGGQRALRRSDDGVGHHPRAPGRPGFARPLLRAGPRIDRAPSPLFRGPAHRLVLLRRAGTGAPAAGRRAPGQGARQHRHRPLHLRMVARRRGERGAPGPRGGEAERAAL
ncbi:MAG: hypothetical protein AVDCRST_MAG89-4230, partial [uncultured Gemmatimonadetes bacterium]